MYKRLIPAGALVVLAACSSGSNNDTDIPTRDIPTDGVFDNVQLPDNADVTRLPSEPRGKISEFITLNERDNATPTADLLGGSAFYDGDFVVEIADNSGATRTILDGDLEMTIDFSNDRITGRMADIEGYDGNNREVPVAGTMSMSADIAGNGYAGQFQDDLVIGGNTVAMDGTLNGIFTGNDARDTLGVMAGNANNADGSIDTVTGVFFAEED